MINSLIGQVNTLRDAENRAAPQPPQPPPMLFPARAPAHQLHVPENDNNVPMPDNDAYPRYLRSRASAIPETPEELGLTPEQYALQYSPRHPGVTIRDARPDEDVDTQRSRSPRRLLRHEPVHDEYRDTAQLTVKHIGPMSVVGNWKRKEELLLYNCHHLYLPWDLKEYQTYLRKKNLGLLSKLVLL